MRPGLLVTVATVAAVLLAQGAAAQGVGTPPMVEPLRAPEAGPPPDDLYPPDDPYARSPDYPPPGSLDGPLPPAAGPPLDVDRVMDRVKTCWTAVPAVYGTPAQGGVARIRIKFTADGRLDGQPMIIDKPQGEIGARFATSAARAIEKCAPYRLPPERYAEWRQIEMRFDTIDPDNPPPPPPAPPPAAGVDAPIPPQ